MSVKRYVAGGLATLGAIVFGVFWASSSADARAYRSAPACQVDTVDISGCRWTVTAPVVGAAADRHARSVSYHLTVDVPTLGRTDVPLSSYDALYDRAASSTGGYALRVTGWHRDVVTLADGRDEVQAADAPLTDAHLTFTLAVVALARDARRPA